MALFWLFSLLNIRHAVLSIAHADAYKSTLVAGGADTQLGSCCVLAPLATNVDLWKPIVTSRRCRGPSFGRSQIWPECRTATVAGHESALLLT